MSVNHATDRLALGTVQFGLNYGVANQSGLVLEADVKEILMAAWDSGICTLDTAVSYGKSEQVLGHCGVRDWKVITKLPPIPEDCRNVASWLKDQVSRSLERLGVDHLYALLLHRPAQLLGKDGSRILNALEDIKSIGLARKIGVSIYDHSELSELTALFNFDLVQAPLNILDQGLINSGWVQKLKECGVEIHVRSAFLQGLLLMTERDRPLKFKKFQLIWAEWDRWLLSINLTPLQACLAYILSVKEIDKLIVGIDGLPQLKEIVAAVGMQLSSYPQWPKELPSNLINPSKWDEL